ncbi:MAG: lipoyl(octanoyl) transferase LipB [Actinomycetales bacterium]
MSTTTAAISIQNLGQIDYETAWQLQRKLHNEVANGGENQLLLLEHPPIFTAGRRTLPEERPTDGSKVIDVDRGGKITFHGPGQLVGYPIVKLREPENVVGFVRELELALIEICQDLGIPGERYCERSGVWIRDTRGDRKIAAIGIRVARGVTMHGFALNVNPDLSYYNRIIPCGIADAGVTSISNELQRPVLTTDLIEVVSTKITEALRKVAI